MPEALKCPSCSAALDYPAGGGTTMHCPYCGSTVVIPSPSASTNFVAAFGSTSNKTLDVAKLLELLQSGNKIEAIKIFRQTHGVDLLSAKTAIDNLAAGRPTPFASAVPNFNSSPVVSVVNNSAKFGCGLATVILVAVALYVSFMLRVVHHKPAPIAIPTWAKNINPPLPGLAAPVASTFAHSTMEFGSEGIGAGQFKDSRSIAVDGKGRIYVGEYSDGRVQVFDPQGNFVTEWSIGSQKSLMNLTANRTGTVFAVTPGHILCFEGATGLAMGEAQNTLQDNPQLYMDAFAALNGDIYALAGGSNIVILDSDGKIKSTFNCSEKVGEDVNFEKIAVVSTGEIYALDRNHGIFKFAPDGRYINRFAGSQATGPAHLVSANGIAIDGAGRIYVTDSGAPIHVFDPDGNYIDSFGENDVAFGITITDKNEILACYRNKHVIQKFALNKP